MGLYTMEKTRSSHVRSSQVSRKNKAQKRKKRRRFRSFYLAMTMVFLVLVITWTVQLNMTERELNDRISDLTDQRNGLTAKNDAYRTEIELLNTPAYIEQLAREKLGLVRKGEIYVEPKKD